MFSSVWDSIKECICCNTESVQGRNQKNTYEPAPSLRKHAPHEPQRILEPVRHIPEHFNCAINPTDEPVPIPRKHKPHVPQKILEPVRHIPENCNTINLTYEPVPSPRKNKPNPTFAKKFNRSTTLQMVELPEYPVPFKLHQAVCLNSPLSEFSAWKNKNTRATEDDYIQFFRSMIHLEEITEQMETMKCNQSNVKIYHVNAKEFYFLIKPEMKELCKSIDNREVRRLILKPRIRNLEFKGEIKSKQSKKIFIELFNYKEHHEDELYDIKFQINRTSYQLQHYALDFVQQHQLFKVLIDHPKYHKVEESHKVSRNEDYKDLNPEQIKVVNDIVNGNYYPHPYLLFGPPGTGKTQTLVCAITKIVLSTKKRILVCAQSNAACDEIAERLSEFLTTNEMFRIYSISKDVDKINPNLKEYCNLFSGSLQYPPLDYIYRYRVVICTLHISGYLSRARCNHNFSYKHFSYVFIDECASALETMAVIPIAGLCTSLGAVHAKIILAGDPKQLDAVTKSKWATEFDFGTSWFEQLINLPLYKHGIATKNLNSSFTTQLVENYRSHPAILHIPNKFFYDGVLQAKASTSIAELNLDLPKLNPNFPIIFKSVQGFQMRTENDPSSFNMQEVNEVLIYIQKLLESETYVEQSDIGVVSPYKLQCRVIERACKDNEFDEVTVGTSEVFQGQERKVMIVSTVVARRKHPGKFVCNPRRLNVILTRAKYLLIVIGDPHTLSKDSNWSEFIKYCSDNKALIQSDRPFPPQTGRKRRRNKKRNRNKNRSKHS